MVELILLMMAFAFVIAATMAAVATTNASHPVSDMVNPLDPAN